MGFELPPLPAHYVIKRLAPDGTVESEADRDLWQLYRSVQQAKQVDA